ncbi:hypothetical protein ABZ129_29140, partial [Streptomyces sp. NPDC006307]
MTKHRIAARLAGVAAVGAVVAGGTVALAPAASAVGSSACTKNVADYDSQTDTTVNFRTGPGTGYTAKGTVPSSTEVRVYCTAKGGLTRHGTAREAEVVAGEVAGLGVPVVAVLG